MTAPVQVGRPARSVCQAAPTLDQLLILVARAERKGGLDYVEGDRLRDGLRRLAEAAATPAPVPASAEVRQEAAANSEAMKELRRKYRRSQQRVSWWKRRARQASGLDEEAREALVRVTELAKRWTHVPGRRQAGAAVLSVISNSD